MSSLPAARGGSMTADQAIRHRTKRAFALEGWDTVQDQPGNKYGSSAGGMAQGIRVLSYLLSGFIVYGGLGWLLDRWLETSFLFPLGMMLGLGLGVFAVIAKFGRVAGPQESDT